LCGISARTKRFSPWHNGGKRLLLKFSTAAGQKCLARLGAAVKGNYEELLGRGLHVLCFGAFLAGDNVENDFLTFMKDLEPTAKDPFVVNEYILTVFLRDETKSLLVVPPLNFATGHNDSSEFWARPAVAPQPKRAHAVSATAGVSGLCRRLPVFGHGVKPFLEPFFGFSPSPASSGPLPLGPCSLRAASPIVGT
jgi:hypothetical protein